MIRTIRVDETCASPAPHPSSALSSPSGKETPSGNVGLSLEIHSKIWVKRQTAESYRSDGIQRLERLVAPTPIEDSWIKRIEL